jgi:hypothetical protein
MAFLGVMDQTMSILIVEEGGSSSTPRSKHHRCYINRNREAAHLRLRHDYFDNDYVYF